MLVYVYDCPIIKYWHGCGVELKGICLHFGVQWGVKSSTDLEIACLLFYDKMMTKENSSVV